ncbi:MAG: carbohydrate ABC transporter permease [Chloroflexi bacterium]|nr:carbohydrate ABC transporter permease [Chloroflexota bacterium]
MATSAVARPTRSRPRRLPWSTLLIYLTLIVGGFFMLAPFLYMLSTSLKPANQVFLYPPRWIPSPIVWNNYLVALGRLGVQPFIVSVIFTTTIVLGQGLVTTMGGFAFARLKFPGREVIFLGYLGTMMIPFVVTMIPTFVIVARLGWQDTYQGLIVPILASGAFGTFLFRQFFMQIPDEIGDAATVDGANPFHIYWKIYLPLSGPALTTYGVITALAAWNMYLWPLIVVQSPALRPLTLVIAQFAGQMNAELHILMACVTISLLPIFLLYLLGQRFFVEGISMTGLKG